MELIDEADLACGAARCARRRSSSRSAWPPTIDLAGVGPFEQAGDMQQRRLAGARRRDQRHRLARPTARARRRSAPRSSSRRGRSGARSRSSRSTVSSLIAQRLDRIEPRRPPRRIDRRQQRQDERQRDDRDHVARVDARRQLRQEVELGREQIASGQPAQALAGSARRCRRRSAPSTRPQAVPTKPIVAPVIRKMRMIAPRVAPIVRSTAIAARLVLHQHDQAGDDVERRHQHDQRQDREHHVALRPAARRRRSC